MSGSNMPNQSGFGGNRPISNSRSSRRTGGVGRNHHQNLPSKAPVNNPNQGRGIQLPGQPVATWQNRANVQQPQENGQKQGAQPVNAPLRSRRPTSYGQGNSPSLPRSRRAQRLGRTGGTVTAPGWNAQNRALPGTAVGQQSIRELLSQPVAALAKQTVTGPTSDERWESYDRAVNMAVGNVPSPANEYPIPYILRRHANYYTGYEIQLIMESIRDPVHARSVLGRIIAFPSWIHVMVALCTGLAALAVSALNAFLSFLAFTSIMAIILMYTSVYSNRIGSGRFYDPLGYKVVWLGAFTVIPLLTLVIVIRPILPQPWLGMIAFLLSAIVGYLWMSWMQHFQIRRFLSTKILDSAGRSVSGRGSIRTKVQSRSSRRR